MTKKIDLINVIPQPAKASDEFREIVASTGIAQAKNLDEFRQEYLCNFLEEYEKREDNQG